MNPLKMENFNELKNEFDSKQEYEDINCILII